MAKAALSDEGLVFVTYADVEVLPPFVDLGMVEDLVRSVYAYGCQQRAILSIVKGCDVTVQSATGKRCVFALVAWLSVTAMTAKSGTCNLHVLTMSLMLSLRAVADGLPRSASGKKRVTCTCTSCACSAAHTLPSTRPISSDSCATLAKTTSTTASAFGSLSFQHE